MDNPLANTNLKPLRLNLKREYWEAIKNGTKKEEYRLCTDYWGKRLQGKTFSGIEICLGYPKKDDDSRILKRPWAGYELKNIEHPLFGAGIKQVYAIKVN